MKRKSLISKIENYVREVMAGQNGTLTIAHDISHVQRVRKWALEIAGAEKYPNPEMVEIAALLHDIGLTRLKENDDRTKHGAVSAEMAGEFLRSNSDLNAEEIGIISDAILHHSLPPSIVQEHLREVGEKGKLVEILRDADIMDAVGVVGIVRGIASHYYLPEYDPENIRGDFWGMSANKYRSLPPVQTIVDQLNQQTGYLGNFHTATARNLAGPLIAYMREFVLQLEREVNHVAEGEYIPNR
jgi:putative nucleotidyltransferase with HDIG domain